MLAGVLLLCGDHRCVALGPPLSLKKVRGELPLSGRKLFVYEVKDFDFWRKAKAEENPYGRKIWPGAVAAARRLDGLASDGRLGRVLEIGCGNGFASLAAAALGAESVLATDVSAAALELTKRAALEQNLQVTTQLFDVFAKTPLPEADLLVAADLFYDEALAAAVADRVKEALRRGTGVLVAGEPSRPARHVFLESLRQDLPDVDFEPPTRLQLTDANWKAKLIEVLYLEAPTTVPSS